MGGFRFAKALWAISLLALGVSSQIASAQLAFLDGVPVEKKVIALELLNMIKQPGGPDLESAYLDKFNDGFVSKATDRITKSHKEAVDCDRDKDCTADRGRRLAFLLDQLSHQPRASVNDQWLRSQACGFDHCVIAETALKPVSAADQRYLLGVNLLDKDLSVSLVTLLAELNVSDPEKPSLAWLVATGKRCADDPGCVSIDDYIGTDQVTYSADKEEVDVAEQYNRTVATWRFALSPQPKLLADHNIWWSGNPNCERYACGGDLFTDNRVHYSNEDESLDFCALGDADVHNNGSFWIPINVSNDPQERPDAWRTVLPAERTSLSFPDTKVPTSTSADEWGATLGATPPHLASSGRGTGGIPMARASGLQHPGLTR